MTPIQIMALIVAVLGAIKLLVIIVDPKIWLKKVVKPIYANTMVASLLGLIIAGVSLYYLNQELTIVQIFAVLLFFMGLMLMSFAVMAKEMVGLADKVLRKDGLMRFWLPMLIWVLLLIWVFYALFA
ncbi:hypothetical protein KY338_03805 [Candidatus Woesearchaeota archaeon]|nr:hypothetical protein [Candidatus Woesearchaeota archaeon]MBW3005437.1 hypothetical protein [Candidatus Woesearchaeota archaeon]